MAQFNRLEIGRRGRSVLNNQEVFVTHVESPSLFFCRLLTENDDFCRLQSVINQVIDEREECQELPVVGAGNDKIVLVYSSIRKVWCRGVIMSAVQATIAKVFLVDYGSIELVVFNAHYVQKSTQEIANFNDGFGFCFPCKLHSIQPFDEIKCKVTNEWSSFSNFVMERETKDRQFVLSLLSNNASRGGNNADDGLVLCDLLASGGENSNVRRSLAHTLVNAGVAARLDGSVANNEDAIFAFDDNKENGFVAL